jgi:hypothetical protein
MEKVPAANGKAFVRKEQWVHDGTWFNVSFGRGRVDLASYRDKARAERVARAVNSALCGTVLVRQDS